MTYSFPVSHYGGYLKPKFSAFSKLSDEMFYLAKELHDVSKEKQYQIAQAIIFYCECGLYMLNCKVNGKKRPFGVLIYEHLKMSGV